MRAEPPKPHSLTKPHSHHLSESTSALSKKMSASSLTHLVDIDRLIDDIKITPHNHSISNHQPLLAQHIAIITHSLTVLRQVPGIVHELRTIELLLESIGKKVAAEGLAMTRVRHVESVHNRQSSMGRSALSPVKQFDESSRIVYANFSLKEVTGQLLQTPIKRIAGSDQKQREESQQMQRLNSEIMMLEKMLKAKGVGSEVKTEGRKAVVAASACKQVKENRGGLGTGKKYELLEKTQEINLARPKPVTIRPKLDSNYR